MFFTALSTLIGRGFNLRWHIETDCRIRHQFTQFLQLGASCFPLRLEYRIMSFGHLAIFLTIEEQLVEGVGRGAVTFIFLFVYSEL